MNSIFEKTIEKAEFILAEGGMLERIRRNSPIVFDPFILHAGFIYEEKGGEILENIYREYLV